MQSYSKRYHNPLIDAIFHAQDQQLRRLFQERMKKMERRDQLAQVSGIRDEAVLNRLMELDIGPEALAALEVVPLVFVAWADGGIHTKEREAIIATAKASGIEPQDGRYPLLEHWLKRRPASQMLEAWKHYISDLCKRLDSQDAAKLKHELLDGARKVAQAAGGFLELGDKMSSAERSVLGELERAFS